jgi:hypothetical protein
MTTPVHVVDEAGIDIVLVGDSLAQTMLVMRTRFQSPLMRCFITPGLRGVGLSMLC